MALVPEETPPPLRSDPLDQRRDAMAEKATERLLKRLYATPNVVVHTPVNIPAEPTAPSVNVPAPTVSVSSYDEALEADRLARRDRIRGRIT